MNPGIQEEMKTEEFWEKVSPGFQFVYKHNSNLNVIEVDGRKVDALGRLDGLTYCHAVSGKTWKSLIGMKDALGWCPDDLASFARQGIVLPLEGRQPMTLSQVVVATGCICKRCNSKNDFAAPNQKDGSYVCFECRV